MECFSGIVTVSIVDILYYDTYFTNLLTMWFIAALISRDSSNLVFVTA